MNAYRDLNLFALFLCWIIDNSARVHADPKIIFGKTDRTLYLESLELTMSVSLISWCDKKSDFATATYFRN